MVEIAGQRLPGFETVVRVLSNMRFPEEEKQPLSVAYYFTFDCSSGCWFCSQKEHLNPGEEDVELASHLEILRIMREGCPNIYLMGGEPTESPYLPAILQECTDLGFESTAVNTNGLHFVPEILTHADMLVISLPSTIPAEIAAVLKKSEFEGMRVLYNLKRYAEMRDPSKTQVIVNCVVSGGNIDQVYAVANLCTRLGILLNVAPAIMPNNRPDKRLIGNPRYQQLIDDLIADNRLMACSLGYLETIRDFEDFDCTPNVIPGVRPNGDLIVPCPNVDGYKLVNLSEVGSVGEAISLGRERFGQFVPAEECRELCHKTCYVEAAQLSTWESAWSVMKRLFVQYRQPVAPVEDEMSEQELKLCTFFNKYLGSIHTYDFIAHSRQWMSEHREFSEEIRELSDEELIIVREAFEGLCEYFETDWRIGYDNEAKVIMAIGHLAIFLATNPFIGIVRRMEKMFNTRFVSDVGWGKALNRCSDYVRRIDVELGSRVPVEFVA